MRGGGRAEQRCGSAVQSIGGALPSFKSSQLAAIPADLHGTVERLARLFEESELHSLQASVSDSGLLEIATQSFKHNV